VSLPTLEIDHLSKSFGALQVVREVSLALSPGARHALIGPNGAGKTTLVNLVSGLLEPASGVIRLDGRDITALTPEQRVSLGLARTFQISSLFPRLSVAENVALALAARFGVDRRIFGRLRDCDDIVDGAGALLESLDLLALAPRRVAALPYGQRRLVEIALALALEPRILLLDEPAAGLASTERHAVIDLLERTPASLTMLVIEHDMSLVFRLARRITVMVEGAVLAEGTPAEIRADARVHDVYLGKRHHA
jgi:branched-chain amino acid transport system ATP-binding protein